jgi:catechol 2,3-dioxygenase-like lactoylglutathione lyase family enzyme
MSVLGLDHVALPSQNPVAMMEFYAALGFTIPAESLWRAVEQPRFSIHFGDQKINLHPPSQWQDAGFTLRGPSALPGCGDLCFVWGGTLDELMAALTQAGAPVIEGPVERLGGRDGGERWGLSVYTRDPDQNLLEFMLYDRA